MPELLERAELQEVVPPVPPEGLETALYQHDERAARADLRRQIAAMELALARLFGSAFPRKGIDFAVAGMGGPRLLSVDELERIRDELASRIQGVRADLHERALVEESNRELIERMTADPASYKWVRVYNEDIGEPGCKNWHVKPRWGPLGMLMGWWRVKISSGCPLAEGQRPPRNQMATKRQRRKRRRRHGDARPAQPGPSAVVVDGAQRRGTARRRSVHEERPPAPWGSFPLSEIVIFVGVLLLIVGFFVPPPQGFVMIAVGLGLASLAGLELSIREHFAGFRSHTLVLAAAVGVPVFGALFVATMIPTPICVAAGLVAFGGSAWLFTNAFRRRSGGALFRLRG
ncbi:MAG TPA: hypothetical protein VH501_09885 [Solirubrobacterales bacterium]